MKPRIIATRGRRVQDDIQIDSCFRRNDNSKMWHSLSPEEVLRKLNSNENGLGEKEAKKRLAEFGLNKLSEEKPVSKLKIFFKQFKSPLVYILVLAGLITLILGKYTDTIVIFGAVILNTAVGFFQENKTSRILRELKKIITQTAVVLRDDNLKEILTDELVPGDVVVLRTGFKVPADCRILEVHNLKINESVLTGEWRSAKKTAEALKNETPLADRDNMAYMGSVVEEGRGMAVVVATGRQTEIGEIASLVKGIEDEQTPFQQKVIHFSKIFSFFVLFIVLFLFVLGVIQEKNYWDMLFTSVAIAVAAVPEGLPAAVTVIFAFGMREVLKKKGLVKELMAAETLGSTSVICTDKTGTLTEANMQVSGIYTGTKELLSDGHNYSAEIDHNGVESHITALKIATLANTAFIENPEDELHRWVVKGRPVEKALLLAGIQAGLNRKNLLEKQPKIDEFPFDPNLRYSATLNKYSANENIIYVLGSPETVLAKSKLIELDGRQEELNRGKLEELDQKTNELTARGEMVLSVAYKIVPADFASFEKDDDGEQEISDLVFVGILALKDPIRKEAKEAIKICQEAGMRVIIVTGDHKLTTKAVMGELGLQVSEDEILEGRDLDSLSDEEFGKAVDKIKIYARVEPRHKIRIVEAWQKKGEVVAMTGDGVNDAPALKKADIGIALGSGTEVAKEASDLILLSDNFSAITTAVEEGRRIIDNVRKVIVYLLEGSFTEMLLIGLSVIFKFPLPILPAQILWQNLIEDTPPAMALTVEPKEKDAMKRRPERINKPLLTKEMKAYVFIVGIITDLALFGLFLWLWFSNFELVLIRSIIFAGLATDSLFLIFSCRNFRRNIWHYNPFSNHYVNFSVVLGFTMLGLALYLPIFQKLLKTVPLGFFEWFLVFGLGLLNLVLIEAVKFYYIKKDSPSR